VDAEFECGDAGLLAGFLLLFLLIGRHPVWVHVWLLDFLDTWVAGGLGLGGLGLGVGLGLPQAPQSPCEFVSVGHAWTPMGP
jgi:hypothetical protein